MGEVEEMGLILIAATRIESSAWRVACEPSSLGTWGHSAAQDIAIAASLSSTATEGSCSAMCRRAVSYPAVLRLSRLYRSMSGASLNGLDCAGDLLATVQDRHSCAVQRLREAALQEWSITRPSSSLDQLHSSVVYLNFAGDSCYCTEARVTVQTCRSGRLEWCLRRVTLKAD